MTAEFVHNLKVLTASSIEYAPHGDTIASYLKQLPPSQTQTLVPKMIKKLIRMKAMDAYRLFGYFLIAIDGTGQMTFTKRHCSKCLSRTFNGKTLYYHNVLEAKLVTFTGLALSVATEFIENINPTAPKQDCELKAFHRLADKLKHYFPQLRICLLLDSLYAAKPVFDCCVSNKWQFIVTLKEGSMPDVFREFTNLKVLCPENRLCASLRPSPLLKEERQELAWIENLQFEDHILQVIDCNIYNPKEHYRFVWLTSFRLNTNNILTIVNNGGRLRWRIENEGFNTQKNGGYELEHAYCKEENALKNFYLLLQVAHILNQLMVKGSLFENFDEQIGSLKNFGKLTREHLRTKKISLSLLALNLATVIRIRLDSS